MTIIFLYNVHQILAFLWKCDYTRNKQLIINKIDQSLDKIGFKKREKKGKKNKKWLKLNVKNKKKGWNKRYKVRNK